MQWTNFYTSSIGRKVVMASTGVFLMAFLAVHLGLNLTIFAADSLGNRGALFNQIANEFHHSWGLHLLEILLFSSFAVHIAQGLTLTWQNKSKRNVAYQVKPHFSLDPARSMGILGVMISAFLLLHLYQFWLPHLLGKASDDLYGLVQKTMNQPWVVAIYVAGCVAVAAHLWHGWRSAAITFGASDRYQRLLSVLGISLTFAVPLGLAAIPVILFTSSHAQL